MTRPPQGVRKVFTKNNFHSTPIAEFSIFRVLSARNVKQYGLQTRDAVRPSINLRHF